MAQDISKTTIMILLVLTIIVSVLSTIIVLDKAQQFKAASLVSLPKGSNEAKGVVSMTIAGPSLPPDKETGEVSVTIPKK